MHKLEPIVYVLVFLTLVMLLEGLYLLFFGSKRQRNKEASERLRRFANHLPAGDLSEEGRTIMVDRGTSDGPSRVPFKDKLELFLYRAGMPLSMRMYLLLTALLGGGGFAVGFLILRDPIRGLALSGLGILPTVFIAVRRRRRMAAFDKQLPEAMELLCRCLRSGHSMRSGFHLVGEELPDPMGTEFARVAEEVAFGMDLRDALHNLAHRIDHPDMPFFINAVMIQRETGGNLAGILESIATMIRERLRFFAKVKSLLAQINMTANALAVIPIVMVFAVSGVNPDYMAPLFETPAGHTMIGICVFLVTAGWLMCRRLGVVKY
ncbi:MAG: hypothetical protein GY725_09820 [bacterium]|nr:hypothetical protein [bacterium]